MHHYHTYHWKGGENLCQFNTDSIFLYHLQLFYWYWNVSFFTYHSCESIKRKCQWSKWLNDSKTETSLHPESNLFLRIISVFVLSTYSDPVWWHEHWWFIISLENATLFFQDSCLSSYNFWYTRQAVTIIAHLLVDNTFIQIQIC